MSDTLTPRVDVIAAGETAPDFTLIDQDRKEWKLSDAVKKGDVVLCFFPFAFTSVCGAEMKCITFDLEKWAAKGATVVGISCDSFASLGAWKEKEALRQPLLSDIHRKVCQAYGLFWTDLNVSKRGTIVIGKDASGMGKVKWSQGREPSKAMNFDEVLASVA